MKTLDEVIKAWSICFSDNSRSNCTGCPYADDDGEAACFNHDREDALHYLKAYKDDRNDLTALRAYWAEQQANPALTWEQLKQMEGKPVWVEGSHGCIWDFKGWVLIETVFDDYVICVFVNTGHGEFAIDKDVLGADWQAYRKEQN